MAISPYTPGAGMSPGFLSGRDKIIENAMESLHILSNHTKTPQSIIYYGLRGVGKTVLLNCIEDIARDFNMLCAYLEVSDSKGFKSDFVDKINQFANQLCFKLKVKNNVSKIKDMLKNFVLSWSSQTNALSLSIRQEHRDTFVPNLTNSLTDLLLELGTVAKENHISICFLIDEFQYLDAKEMEAIISAVHRCNQKALPIMVVGAGLPRILSLAANVRTYAERLFHYVEVDSLDYEDASSALTEPAKTQGVSYEKAAIDDIVNTTEGYPYFIQEYGDTIWKYIGNDDVITTKTVNVAKDDFINRLDNGFFRVRYDRATRKEKEFMYAMAQCSTIPASISEIAEIMNVKNPSSISPFRAQLIGKGFIYSTGYGNLDFTVPQFAQFLLRHGIN